jgi:hypothetical protein
MLSGSVMLVSSQCQCNSLNARPNRCGGDTDCANEMWNLANPYSEAAKTPRHCPDSYVRSRKFLPAPLGSPPLASLVFRNSDNASGDISLDRTGSVLPGLRTLAHTVDQAD